MGIVVLIVFALFFFFFIYFIYKYIEFVVQAVDLYKKMIERLDGVMKLLLDIRDNTKKFNGPDVDKPKRTPVYNRDRNQEDNIYW